MKTTSTRGWVEDAALGWSRGLGVEVGGAGTVAQAGVVLPRLLADRLGLTTGLAAVVARVGFTPLRHRGRLLVDATCALAAGATCLADVEAMTAQAELFGPGGGASDSTMPRALDELAGRIRADGLPGRRLAEALAATRARAWSQIAVRHARLPAVMVAGQELTRPATESADAPAPVLVIRVDATLIEAASAKAQAAGNYKGGFGFHPLTSWCTNIGDALAIMQRPGNAGSFTAAGAPRGASLYPQRSWEELGGRFLGLMAYLDPKGEGDKSMPLKQWLCPGIRNSALRDPRDMVKAILPES